MGGKVEDAVVVEETPAKSVTPGAKVNADTGPDADKTAPGKGVADKTGEDAASDKPKATASADKDTAASSASESKASATSKMPPQGAEPPRTTEMKPAPAPAIPPEPERRSSFVPMVLGGVIAAALGAGALYYSTTQDWIDLGGNDTAELDALIAAQATEIDTLQAALDTAQADITALKSAEPDLSPITTAQTELQNTLTAAQAEIAALKTQIDGNDARLAEVETQPIPKAELPAEVVRAYETKLTELQTALDARLTSMQSSLDTKFTTLETAQGESLSAIEKRLTDRLAEIEAQQADATQLEESAQQAARAAEARAALARITSGLDTGTPFNEALADLKSVSDADIPAALGDLAETGTASLSTLQAQLPEYARAALVASTRAAADDGQVGGMTAFLRTQLGARSLSPRDGDDPDAVLSRAEAAVASGDLEGALTEIETLPTAGQDALSEWVADARALQSAKAALGTLATQFNNN